MIDLNTIKLMEWEVSIQRTLSKTPEAYLEPSRNHREFDVAF